MKLGLRLGNFQDYVRAALRKIGRRILAASRARRAQRGRYQGRPPRGASRPAGSRREFSVDAGIPRARREEGGRRRAVEGRQSGPAAREGRLRRTHGDARLAARRSQAEHGAADDRDARWPAGLRQDDNRRQAGAQDAERAAAHAAHRVRFAAPCRHRPVGNTGPAARPRGVCGARHDRCAQGGTPRSGSGAPRAGSRRHRGHGRPLTDRRRTDGRAGAAQGGDQSGRNPPCRRRHDGSGSREDRAGL